MKHFLSITDMSKNEMQVLFKTAARIKKETRAGKSRSDLMGKTLVMIFEKINKTEARRKNLLIATPIYPPDVGGPATYAKKIREEFKRRGIESNFTYNYSVNSSL